MTLASSTFLIKGKIIAMITATTRAELESALAIGDGVTIEVPCHIDCTSGFSTRLAISGTRKTIFGGGRLNFYTGPGPLMNGTACCLAVDVFAQDGIGVEVTGSKNHIEGHDINSKNDGIWAHGSAGLWVRDALLNGIAPSASNESKALNIEGWDTAFIDDVLTEEHHTGMRLGMNQAASNIIVGSLAVDRAVVGVHLQPSSAIHNVSFANYWAAGRAGVANTWPLIAGGLVTAVQFANWRVSDFTQPRVVQNGAQVQFGNVIGS